ncbi:hypothetical protein GCM10028818_11330 [Spirosoma horti]
MDQTLQAGTLYFLKMFHHRGNPPPTYRQPGAIHQYVGTTVTFPTDLCNMIGVDRQALAQSDEAGKCTNTFF